MDSPPPKSSFTMTLNATTTSTPKARNSQYIFYNLAESIYLYSYCSGVVRREVPSQFCWQYFGGGGGEYSVLFNLCIIFSGPIVFKVVPNCQSSFCFFPYSYPHIQLALYHPSFEDRGWKPCGAAEVAAAACLHAGGEAKGQEEGNPRPSEAIIKPQLNRRQNVKRVPIKHTALFSTQSSYGQLCRTCV